MTDPTAQDALGPAVNESTSVRLVTLDCLRPHPDNPNHMPASRLQKLVTHIRQSGRYEPLIVRPHPSEEGLYQILNGHHRAQALRAAGYDRAACIVWHATDREARIYLATLNRLVGADIPEKRAALRIAAAWATPGAVTVPEAMNTDDALESLDALDWLWERTSLDVGVIAQAAGASEAQVRRRLPLLRANQIVYPDGTVHGLVRRLLQERVLRAFAPAATSHKRPQT